MKHAFFSLLAAFSFSCFAAESPLPSHTDLTHTILDFLSRIELCLNSCKDETSVKSAIPRLKELQQECGRIVEIQRSLPEPTIQDYMAVQNQMEAFNTVWGAIRDHIERLETERLMSEEMRQILHIAPRP